MKNATIAVIDRYLLIRYAVCYQLQRMGYNVSIQAEDGVDFMIQAQNTSSVPEVCVLDIDTPYIEKYTTARQIKAKYPNIKILAYTLYEREYKAVKQYGIDVFLTKNCSYDELNTHVQNLIRFDGG